MKKVLIIGGGPAGCAAAHQLKMLGGLDITLIEKSNILGGGCKTLLMGGHPYTFGPRHFITDKQYLFDFLNQYVPMRSCAEHEFKTYVETDDQFYNFPIREDDLEKMPDYDAINLERKNAPGAAGAKNLEEYWVNSVGKSLFNKFINDYNKKMWMVKSVSEIDTFNWSPKGPSIAPVGHQVFSDKISAYPIKMNGYDDYFDIAVQGVKVHLNTSIAQYDLPMKRVMIDKTWYSYDIIVNTLPPDMVLNNIYGELPFIGRDFYPFVLPVEHAFPENIYFLYYAGRGTVTRCVEYKKLTRYQSKNTLLGIEVPSLSNRLYPLPIKAAQDLADKYFELMPQGVYSIGRAGVYRYGIDFDRCIDHGMIVARDVKEGAGGSGSVLGIDPTGEQLRKVK
jgi:UDP-galactopyranose mutase